MPENKEATGTEPNGEGFLGRLFGKGAREGAHAVKPAAAGALNLEDIQV
jgi:hypothetical protein